MSALLPSRQRTGAFNGDPVQDAMDFLNGVRARQQVAVHVHVNRVLKLEERPRRRPQPLRPEAGDRGLAWKRLPAAPASVKRRRNQSRVSCGENGISIKLWGRRR